MSLKVENHHFTGKVPIQILDFTPRFVQEEKIQGMSKAQAFIALPAFPTRLARSEDKTGIAVTASQFREIYSWKETIQNLLRHYATDRDINSEILDLRGTSKKVGERDIVCKPH